MPSEGGVGDIVEDVRRRRAGAHGDLEVFERRQFGRRTKKM